MQALEVYVRHHGDQHPVSAGTMCALAAVMAGRKQRTAAGDGPKGVGLPPHHVQAD